MHGALHAVNDCANEICFCKIVILSRFVAVRLANPKSITISDGHGGSAVGSAETLVQQNDTHSTIAFATSLLRHAGAWAKLLGVDTALQEQWASMLEMLVKYPLVNASLSTDQTQMTEIFALFGGAPLIPGDATFNPPSNMFSVYPAGSITRSSDPALVKIARDTLSWLDGPGNTAFADPSGDSFQMVFTWAFRLDWNQSASGKSCLLYTSPSPRD